MAICVSCGADNPDDPRYCVACGEEMGRVTSPDAHPDEVVDDEVTTGGASASAAVATRLWHDRPRRTEA